MGKVSRFVCVVSVAVAVMGSLWAGSAGAVPSVRESVPGKVAAETGWCDVLVELPGYTTTYDGARVTVPSGRVLLRELSADGVTGKARQTACKALVTSFAVDHK